MDNLIDNENNLDIDAKYIDELYEWYLNDNLTINRRYQRKLVWTIKEKQELISSLLKKYPIPLLLFVRTNNKREILDGLQRLEAIMSFIEQRYPVNGEYFNLDSMVLTKEKKDSGELVQKLPIMSRQESSGIARYKLAISEYSSDNEDIDEVFRRINSNGKRLSRQEIRCAGCTTYFSDLVRIISTTIRGDTTHTETLALKNVHSISIASDKLDYGINIDNHFYVRNNVLIKSNIRESLDEELVSNILAYIMLEEKPLSSSDALDGFYGVRDTTHTLSDRNALDKYIKLHSVPRIKENYIYVYDIIDDLFKNNNFKKHVLGEQSRSHECPRYYQVVFLAFYDLLINKNKVIKDKKKLLEQLKNVGSKKIIDVTEASRWKGESREKSVDDLVAHIDRFFKMSPKGAENQVNTTEINTLLTNSKTEQTYYDFKQGIYTLDKKTKIDKKCLSKIVETCVAIHNINKTVTGYILVGIAEDSHVCKMLDEIYGKSEVKVVNGFHLIGVDREATNETNGLDGYFLRIKQFIEESNINKKLKMQILKDITFCIYEDKHILKITIKSTGEVCAYNNTIYVRQGANNKEIKGIDEQNVIYSLYNS